MRDEARPLPKAMIFDWDNTLVDTWPVIHDSMNTTLAEMGHEPWTIDQTRDRVRRALREAFPDLFGDEWERARDIFYKRFRAIHLERLEKLPAADELLSHLSESGMFLAVVSNKNGDHLRKEAEHLGWTKYFTRFVGATDAEIDKPSRIPVDLALSESGIQAGSDVWFVGDTDIDMQCARNAGCVSVLVRESPPEASEFGNNSPNMHFSSLKSLLGLVTLGQGSILKP